jgi:hypothetical protein
MERNQLGQFARKCPAGGKCNTTPVDCVECKKTKETYVVPAVPDFPYSSTDPNHNEFGEIIKDDMPDYGADTLYDNIETNTEFYDDLGETSFADEITIK